MIDIFESDFSTRIMSEWMRHKDFNEKNVNEIDFWNTTKLKSSKYWKIYFFVKKKMFWVFETAKTLKLIKKLLNKFLQNESIENN